MFGKSQKVGWFKKRFVRVLVVRLYILASKKDVQGYRCNPPTK